MQDFHVVFYVLLAKEYITFDASLFSYISNNIRKTEFLTAWDIPGKQSSHLNLLLGFLVRHTVYLR
jgi:hypothetical protein